MEQFSIEVYPREGSGSADARRCRNEGLIPSVIYSRGQAGKHVSIPGRAFLKLASRAKSSQVFTFESKLSELNGKSVLVKEVQRNTLNGDVLHVDFLEISEFEEVTVDVSLRFIGEAPGVKLDGGILSVAMHEVTVRCLPKAIPQEFAIDISNLRLGDSLHLSDLPVPAGVTIDGDADETVVSVVAVHVQIEEAKTAAAEGEAATEGAAPAEGAAEGAAASGGDGEKSGEGAGGKAAADKKGKEK